MEWNDFLRNSSDTELAQRLGVNEVPAVREDFSDFDAGEDRQLPPADLDYLLHFAAKQSLYPYNAGANNTCKFSTSMVGAKVSSFAAIPAKNVTAMQAAIQKYGPIAVAITIINSFQYYTSGVYDDVKCSNQSINHAVSTVGWGTQNGTNHWIIRNSWGTSWGQKGYILMKRGVNLCNVEDYPYYAIPL
ncbi:cathepsin K-like [Daphnia carinata]|uniref:cathepsin K-like n=1 Tax=Daphnia carinata TaxID=120202 RepID=UPI0028684108|nr:cathepsin K-like [Daphnia carinata]